VKYVLLSGWLIAYIICLRNTGIGMLFYPPGYDTHLRARRGNPPRTRNPSRTPAEIFNGFFYRVDKARSPASGGVGLGSSIALWAVDGRGHLLNWKVNQVTELSSGS